MAVVRDWTRHREMWIGVLRKQTGESVDAWHQRIRRQRFKDQGVDAEVVGYLRRACLENS